MKFKYLSITIMVFGLLSISSCNKEKYFEQPNIEVTGYTLLELPDDYTHLEIDLLLSSNDKREVLITDAVYQVVVEGITAEEEEVDINQTIVKNTPLELSLPLTIVTSEAIQLLSKLDAGDSLAYSATGTFHIDEPILDLFDLPLNIQGKAAVDVGYEEFYEQPEITVVDISYDYTLTSLSSYTFDFDVNCTVENMDTRDVIIDEVEYIAIIEGVESNTHLYSDTYSTNLSISGGETIELTLPLTLKIGLTDGTLLIKAMIDKTIDYKIEGTFHAIEVDGSDADFILPLYEEGTVPASVIAK